MDLFYILAKDGKNDHPRGHGGQQIKARATGSYAYSGTLVVSSKSQLVVSTEFPLMSDWSSLLTWATATAAVSDIPITSMSSPESPLMLAVTNGTARATPSLDVAAMKRRGMMRLV